MNPAAQTVNTLAASTNPNRGRLVNFMVGITGVASGGQMTVNQPVNSRVHRGSFDCAAIAYGLGGPPTATLEPGDTGNATFALTVANGVITAVATSGAGTSTLADGTYPLQIIDPAGIGVGAQGTYTVATGVVTTAAITVGGSVGPVPPDLFFNGNFTQKVNGNILRDILPVDMLAIAFAHSALTRYIPRAGELPFFFTEPWRNINAHNTTTSWDLIGQSTWQITAGISSAISSPQVTGWYEFDYIRNQRAQTVNGKTAQVLFVDPVRQHTFNIPCPSGQYIINFLPFDCPIQRMWFAETGPGSIYQLEIHEDGNLVLQATAEQLFEAYQAYGFLFGVGPVPNTQTGVQVGGTYQPAQTSSRVFQTYDAAFISDPDQRLFKALIVNKQLLVYVYSTAQTNLKVVMEMRPGGYKG